MHKRVIIPAVAVVVLVVLLGFFVYTKKSNVSEYQTEPRVIISMTKDGFSPSDVSIQKGDTIRFVNNAPADCPASDASCFFWPASNLHPTHELYPEFDPRTPISPGESWSFTFVKPGNWGFHDHLHPNKRGTVTITE